MMGLRTKSTHSTPWSQAWGMLRFDTERRFLPRFKNRGLAPSNVSKKLVEDFTMLAYEFYWLDERKKVHFIGILPERRKMPDRISKESILNWGKMVIGDNSEVKDIYYVKVEF
jgi:hypothetical protein